MEIQELTFKPAFRSRQPYVAFRAKQLSHIEAYNALMNALLLEPLDGVLFREPMLRAHLRLALPPPLYAIARALQHNVEVETCAIAMWCISSTSVACIGPKRLEERVVMHACRT